jgi:hypothetical protein
MSKITINGNVTGTHAHIGDNNFYSAPIDFYKSNLNIKYTELEQELVDIIFEKAPTVEERQQILNSLRTIKENEGSEGHEESNKQNMGRIRHFLSALGTDAAAKILVEVGAHLIQHS